jgi:hypothetical protein
MITYKKLIALFGKKYNSRGARFIINCYRLYYAFMLSILLILIGTIYFII